MKKNIYFACLFFWCILLIGCYKNNMVSETENEVVSLTENSFEENMSEETSEDISNYTTELTTQDFTNEIPVPKYLYDLETPLLNDLTASELLTNTSLYVQDLSDDSYVLIGGGAKKSASLIKLFVAGSVYENMDILKERESYTGDTEDLIRKMITVSDNDATNTLVNRLGNGSVDEGMNIVNLFCQNHGFTQTSMGRLMLDFSSSSDNYTSVEDCGKFLLKIYNNELKGSESILSYMKQQERTGKIPAGVPGEVETANKTGELSDVENDVAIIFDKENPYIICIMMCDLSDTSVGRNTIITLSSDTYNYFCREEQE